MEIRFRAKRAAFNMVVESIPNDMKKLWTTDKHGHQYNCNTETGETRPFGKLKGGE